MKLGSLFDGIGGFPLSAIQHGIDPVWASEIEPFPIVVTKKHFPNMKHLGDITQINGAEIEPVEIITGGSPCQDLSVAGKRAGLAGKRSGLFMEQVRIVKEMREHDRATGRTSESIRPRFMVWENVPGAFSSNGGEDFRAVLEETARIADETVTIPRPRNNKWNTAGAIMGRNFSIAWRVLDAQYWGVPQRRRRIFLVADFAGHSAGEILFKCESVSRDFAESREAREEVAAGIGEGVTTAGGKRVTATITATYGTKWNGNSGADTGDHFVLAESRETGEKVTAGVATGPRTTGAIAFNGDQSEKTRSMGESVEQSPTLRAGGAVHVAYGFDSYNQDAIPEAINPIRSASGGDTKPMVAVAFACNQRDEVRDMKDKSGALQAQPGMKQQTFVLQGSMIGRADKNGPQGDGINEDVSFTLNTTDRHAVAYGICSDASNSMKSGNPHSGIYEADTSRTIDQNGGNPACNQGGMEIVQLYENHGQDSRYTGPLDVAPSVTATYGMGGNNTPLVQNIDCTPNVYREGSFGDYVEGEFGTLKASGGVLAGGSETFVSQSYTVRRLTPTECERLQGFPDNWTNIPGTKKVSKEELEFWRGVWYEWDKMQSEEPEEVSQRTDKAILRWLKNPTSDTARYKALGNSVAIPCTTWIMGQIAKKLKEEKR